MKIERQYWFTREDEERALKYDREIEEEEKASQALRNKTKPLGWKKWSVIIYMIVSVMYVQLVNPFGTPSTLEIILFGPGCLLTLLCLPGMFFLCVGNKPYKYDGVSRWM